MNENELQAKLSIQLGQALAGLKSLGGELRAVKANVAELTANTNKLQQETAKTTKTQVDGANQAGKAQKSYNDLVREQALRLQDAKIKAAALADAQRMLGMNAPKRIIAPTVEEFRAIDRAQAAALGFGRAQHQAAEQGKTGLALLHQGWVRIAAGAAIAGKTIGQVIEKMDELEKRREKNYREGGSAAMTIDQAIQSTGATDVEGITEEAMKMKGPFTQKDVANFVNDAARANPDAGNDQWRAMLSAFQKTASVPGAGQSIANLSSLAPSASAGELAQMVREYTKASGGRAMGDNEAGTVQSLVNSGFFTAPSALALVGGLAAYDKAGQAGDLAQKLAPPKATGDPIKDALAMDEWQNSVGRYRGTPGGAGQAVANMAPDISAQLTQGPLGRRVSMAEYRLRSGIDAGAYAPRSLRAEFEEGERTRERDTELDAMPDEMGMMKAREEARNRAERERRKNEAARGGAINDRMLTDLMSDVPIAGRAVNWWDRQLNGSLPVDPGAQSRPVQVEIIRDTTIRPLTY
jgi:hypothetical protein